jgi:site-specific recombinase XerD
MLVPRVIAEAGDQAARRFLEFFAATIRNKNTRMAYYRAVVRFFAWCDKHKIGEIADIEPLHVADAGKVPLFRSAAGRAGTLTETPMNRVDAWRMIQRRAAELGVRARIGCHTFRATGITAYLEAGGTLDASHGRARKSAHDQAL